MTVEEAYLTLSTIYCAGMKCDSCECNKDGECDWREAVHTAYEALIKQIPRKPKATDIDYRCPCCGMLLAPMCNYCEVCGQKIGTGWDEE